MTFLRKVLHEAPYVALYGAVASPILTFWNGSFYSLSEFLGQAVVYFIIGTLLCSVIEATT